MTTIVALRRAVLIRDVWGDSGSGRRERIPAGAVVELLARTGDRFTVRRGALTAAVHFLDLLPL
jgi:hypothetical protein